MGDGVLEMRLVVTAADYDEALAFYRDVLGLTQLAAFDDGAGHVTILDAGRATLELSDVPHAEHIDAVEVGRRVAGHIRVAFEVPDAAAATDRLVARRRHAHRAADADPVALAELAARRPGRAPADAVPERGAGVLALGQADVSRISERSAAGSWPGSFRVNQDDPIENSATANSATFNPNSCAFA